LAADTKKEVDLFIFDLDGTLADSKKDIGSAINSTITSLGFDSFSEEEIVELVGNGIPKLLSGLTGDDNEAAYHMFMKYAKYMDMHLLDTTKPFPGVLETLSGIGKKKAIVTNKLSAMAEKVIAGLGMDHQIDLVVGADTASRMKPDPEPILYTIEKFGVEPSRTVMVGDTTDDVLSAKAAGVISCGVTYGFGKRDDLISAGAGVIIDSFPDLFDHFE
jgi:phosphoglycolate phosphatase